MKFINLFSLIVSISLFATSSSHLQAQDMDENWETLMEYQEAHNANRLNEAMKYLDDSIQFIMVGSWALVGRDTMRKKAQYDIGLNSDIEFNHERIVGDTIYTRVTEKNDWYKSIGVDRFEYESMAVIFNDDGKITKFIARPNPAVNKYIIETLEHMQEWAAKNEPALYARLMPKGEMVYTKENARDWIELTNAWMKERGQ